MSWYIDHTLEVCLSWCELSRDAVLTTASFAMNVAAWNSLKILGVSEIHLMWLASGQRMSKVQDPPWGGPSSMCPRLPPVPAYVLELFMLVLAPLSSAEFITTQVLWPIHAPHMQHLNAGKNFPLNSAYVQFLHKCHHSSTIIYFRRLYLLPHRLSFRNWGFASSRFHDPYSSNREAVLGYLPELFSSTVNISHLEDGQMVQILPLQDFMTLILPTEKLFWDIYLNSLVLQSTSLTLKRWPNGTDIIV